MGQRNLQCVGFEKHEIRWQKLTQKIAFTESSPNTTTVDTLLAACRRVRDAGYKKIDAFTPFPVHGIDKALGIKPTHLPWIALGGRFDGHC